MFRGAVSLTFAALATASPAVGYDQRGEAWAFFVTTCGQYIADQSSPGQQAVDSAYVMGWMSAWNSYVPGADLRGDHWRDDVSLWLQKYCRDNPFETIQTGLHALMPLAPK